MGNGLLGGLFDNVVKAGDTYKLYTSNYLGLQTKTNSMAGEVVSTLSLNLRGSVRIKYLLSSSDVNAHAYAKILLVRNGANVWESTVSQTINALYVTVDVPNIEQDDLIRVFASTGVNYSTAKVDSIEVFYDKL